MEAVKSILPRPMTEKTAAAQAVRILTRQKMEGGMVVGGAGGATGCRRSASSADARVRVS